MAYSFRIDNRRRSFPTVSVFENCVRIFEVDVYREDVVEIERRLTELLPEVETFAYPTRVIRDTINLVERI